MGERKRVGRGSEREVRGKKKESRKWVGKRKLVGRWWKREVRRKKEAFEREEESRKRSGRGKLDERCKRVGEKKDGN